MNIVDIKNASVKRGAHIALNNISLQLPLGQHHAILGPNGAGKSSLIKLITRELYPLVADQSYVRVFGEEHVNIWSLREKIGFVSQDYQEKYRSLATGIDVVMSGFYGAVGIQQHHSPTEEMNTETRRVLSALHCENLAERAFLQLSTGQQRRLLLARALVHKPKALLLDEPTSGLDMQARFWLINQMRQLAQSGTTIILVTHEPSEIIPEIAHTTLLKSGKIFASGLTEQTLTRGNLHKVFECEVNVHKIDGHYHVTAM